MGFYPVEYGGWLPEVYHFGFNSSHFQLFITPEYWPSFVDLAEQYALRRSDVVKRKEFLVENLHTAVVSIDGFVCVEIPVGDENEKNSIKELGRSLESVLFVLQGVLSDIKNQNTHTEKKNAQLFVLETFIGNDSIFHSAGIELTISVQARKYLENLGWRGSFKGQLTRWRSIIWRNMTSPPGIFVG